MNKIQSLFQGAVYVLMFIFYGILLLPIYLLSSPFWWIKRRRFDQGHSDFLSQLEGKNFFCYNKRKKGREFIENQIIPNLPLGVEVIFLNGKRIENDKYEPQYLSKTFYNFKNYNRFPHLFKVRNGEAIDCSLNSELFSCLNHGVDTNVLFNKVASFFEPTS